MSISKVAQIANVPYATAWRIINNQPCRSEEAVQAVMTAMDRLGYHRNGARKRGRRPKAADGIRTHNIALLHLRKGSSISTTVLTHVQQLLSERNLNLIFAHVERHDALPQAVRAGNVDGILGYGEFPADAITPSLRRIPAVWMMSRQTPTADAWGDRVQPDHGAIGRLAADYLLGRGHRHLAYLNPNPQAAVFNRRGRAFIADAQAKAESVLSIEAERIDPARQEEVTAMERAAEQFVQAWLAADPRPTGLFIPVDRMTLRVHHDLVSRGVRPGVDVELVSCDRQEELLSLMRPSPVSIDLNRRAIARLAVERLLLRMRNGTGEPSIVITVSPELPRQEESPAQTTSGKANGSASTQG